MCFSVLVCMSPCARSACMSASLSYCTEGREGSREGYKIEDVLPVLSSARPACALDAVSASPPAAFWQHKATRQSATLLAGHTHWPPKDSGTSSLCYHLVLEPSGVCCTSSAASTVQQHPAVSRIKATGDSTLKMCFFFTAALQAKQGGSSESCKTTPDLKCFDRECRRGLLASVKRENN